ncbi:MAG: methyltransferase domain-containing protein [Chlamydiae bacterium]|nr:methyltransferase domain-containing protein [Chlamydiota bacterium]
MMQKQPCKKESKKCKNSSHLTLAKDYWKTLLFPEDVAIDATCGNGHDTLFLAKQGISYLLGIDVQVDAVNATKVLLKENLSEKELEHVQVVLGSHENLEKYPIPQLPKLIVYNLGYLPKGDKLLTTKTESTLQSLSSALKILDPKGAISITCYPGHMEGQKEEEALLQFVKALPHKEWEVCFHKWPNKPPLSPSFLWIRRI